MDKMNKKGQLTFGIIIALAVGALILILGLVGGFTAIFSKGFLAYIIGGGLIVLTLIYIAPAALSGDFTKQKRNFLVVMVLIGVGIILIGATGVLQTDFPGGTYVQAPTFYYYECAPATGSLESTHVTLTTGSSNGWITCPSNTDTCDLWISQTEKTAWYSSDRSILYQICHNNGANCDPQVRIGSDTSWWQITVSATAKTGHISNLLSTDRVYINYQYSKLFGGWADQANGAEWYHTYKPFILWKVDMFGGGRNEYTSPAQGCNFPSSAVSNLIDSVTNSAKQLNTQSSTSDTILPFYKTRNFIGTYVPISTANVNFVTYNGQQGYCLQRQVFAISTVQTNGATYQIVDSNFNTRLAPSVDCCPGETEPTRKCNSNFQWENIAQAQCSSFNACAGANWADSGSKTQTRYNCVNGQCVAETRQVTCTYNTDCGTGMQCDTLTHSCVAVTPGLITCPTNQTLVNGVCKDIIPGKICAWYQDEKIATEKIYAWYDLFHMGTPTVVTTGYECVSAGWILWVIIGAVGITAIVLLLKPIKPLKRRSK